MDVEKTIAFILDQQAATTATVQQLSSDVLILKEVVESHEEDLQVHTEWNESISQALQDLTLQVKDAFTTLAAKQSATEENLNILIKTVQAIVPHLPPQQ